MAITKLDKTNEMFVMIELASLMTRSELLAILANMGQTVSDRYDFMTKTSFEPIHPELAKPLKKCLKKFGVL